MSARAQFAERNDSTYTKADIDDIEVDEDGPPDHLWNSIAPSTFHKKVECSPWLKVASN